MAAFGRHDDVASTVLNQPSNTEARPRPKHNHRGAWHTASFADGTQVLLCQMRQSQRGCLEVVY